MAQLKIKRWKLLREGFLVLGQSTPGYMESGSNAPKDRGAGRGVTSTKKAEKQVLWVLASLRREVTNHPVCPALSGPGMQNFLR